MGKLTQRIEKGFKELQFNVETAQAVERDAGERGGDRTGLMESLAGCCVQVTTAFIHLCLLSLTFPEHGCSA